MIISQGEKHKTESQMKFRRSLTVRTYSRFCRDFWTSSSGDWVDTSSETARDLSGDERDVSIGGLSVLFVGFWSVTSF